MECRHHPRPPQAPDEGLLILHGERTIFSKKTLEGNTCSVRWLCGYKHSPLRPVT